MKRIALTNLCRNFARILEQVGRGKALFLIARHCVPMAVLLGIADFNEVLKKQLNSGFQDFKRPFQGNLGS
jgi:hypothetical protein